jgi:hypothetical protein
MQLERIVYTFISIFSGHFPVTMTTHFLDYARTLGYYRTMRNLENDHQYFKNQIGIFQQMYQNLSAVVQGFEEVVQENEMLKEVVKSLKETVAE